MPESSIQLKSSQVFTVSRQQRIPSSVPFNASFVRKTLEVKGFQTHPLCCLSRTCWASHTSPSLCAVTVTRHSCGFFSLSQYFSAYVWPPVFKWWVFSASLTKTSHSHFLYTPPHRNKSASWLIETLSCQSLCLVPSLPAPENSRDAGKWLNCNTEPWEQ